MSGRLQRDAQFDHIMRRRIILRRIIGRRCIIDRRIMDLRIIRRSMGDILTCSTSPPETVIGAEETGAACAVAPKPARPAARMIAEMVVRISFLPNHARAAPE